MKLRCNEIRVAWRLPCGAWFACIQALHQPTTYTCGALLRALCCFKNIFNNSEGLMMVVTFVPFLVFNFYIRTDKQAKKSYLITWLRVLGEGVGADLGSYFLRHPSILLKKQEKSCAYKYTLVYLLNKCCMYYNGISSWITHKCWGIAILRNWIRTVDASGDNSADIYLVS